MNKSNMEKISWQEIKANQFTKIEQQEIDFKVQLKITMRKLREERLRRGLSQAELAVKAGLPRTTISKVESGFQNTSILKVMQIASALGKEVEINLVNSIASKNKLS